MFKKKNNWPFDAIIVFGGGISLAGILSLNSRVRVTKAVELWKQNKAPVIVMSGAWPAALTKKPVCTEATAMAKYAQLRGCPKTNILLEEQAKETVGNAYFSKIKYVIPRRWKKLIIIAADYHLARVKIVCSLAFGNNYQLVYRGAKLPMSEIARRRRQVREQALARIFKRNMVVTAGDHQQIWRLVKRYHHAYSKNAKYSSMEMKKTIDREISRLSNINP